MSPAYIVWTTSPELFSLGPITLRWYGLLFASGFLVGHLLLQRIYKKENRPLKDLDNLTIYMVGFVVVGARLGHCLFYEPDYYLAHPIEILKVWEGGLASHGATIGIALGLFIYTRRNPQYSFIWIADRLLIIVALAACLVRMGNLFNSEIYGKPTGSSYGFVYPRDYESLDQNNLAVYQLAVQDQMPELAKMPAAQRDAALSEAVETNLLTKYDWQADPAHLAVPRHPTQLYEAGTYFILFLLLLYLYRRYKGNLPPGLFTGMFLLMLFSARFVIEFFKENQVDFEDALPINMGQILSIIPAVAGLVVLVVALRKRAAQQAAGK